MNHPTTLAPTSARTTARFLFKSMRPKQWTKNAFVFAGIIFAEKQLVADPSAVGRVLAAFALFCLVSSGIYLINDLVDIEQDRQHPRKRLRPLPSGKLSPTVARWAALLLLIGSLLLPALLAWNNGAWDGGWAAFTVVLALYTLLQIAYSFALKHMVIIDLFAIAGGFVLRAIGGAAIITVSMTPWWLLCVLLLALFLGLGKRYNELRVLEEGASSHRRILQEYSPRLLEHLITIDVACTIMTYSLATFTAPAVPIKPFPVLMLTIPFVIYALFRYLYLIIQRGEGGEPADLLFRDRPFFISIAGWGVLVMIIMLLFRTG
ncbi:MAG: decaprenyl-phosphate phosphoribosyltransferase [Herpetosiphon sp.]